MTTTQQKYTSVPSMVGQVYPASYPLGDLPGKYDGRYRLWAAVHGLDFDSMASYADGGPATVAYGDWLFSMSTLDTMFSSPEVVAADDGWWTVSAWRGDYRDPERHPLNGQRFPTRIDAGRAAYNAGLLAFMVYEKHAAHYGLAVGHIA